ncbi:MAG: ribonuclease PH [Planctomycetes bacterium]|nr:ribonuclease PH [Planctomycetota bacterium]
MGRKENRKNNEIRPIKIIRHYLPNTHASCLISFGKTIVLCTAKSEAKRPEFLFGTNKGWVTAEYAMIPGSTIDRKARERFGKADSRSLEIQRLVGRCLRAVCDLQLLGERSIWIDCEVLNADGGTRTASITGAFVALVDCIQELKNNGVQFKVEPIKGIAAACSVGIVNGKPLLDLAYEEDSRAEMDMNVCANHKKEIIEVQATSESSNPITQETFNSLLNLALEGTSQITQIQRDELKDIDFLPR